VAYLTIGAPVQVCFESISDDIALPMFRLAGGEPPVTDGAGN
jgi:hypothetical protein